MRRKRANELSLTSDPHPIQARTIGQPKGPSKKGFKAVRRADSTACSGSDVEYFEAGRKKSLSRKELAVKQHIQKGIRGNLANIAALLDMRDEAKKSRRAKPRIIIENWVPTIDQGRRASKKRTRRPRIELMSGVLQATLTV